ncbi:hypothetical protein ACETRX_03850 [Labrys portucalensis]|uniref:Uncharacterized protein n=1 Tax=Labrys neptuniae TaxID=376174 RepID=A0ABV6Z987_9HYPH
MPANTGFGTLTIGKDVSIDVTLPSGQVLNIDRVTSFDKKQETTSLNSKGMDGIHRFAEIPDGWTGSIGIDRGGHSLDDFFAALEADYYATGTLNNVRITETIEDTDGTVTQFRYDGVAMKFSDAGKSQPDAYVTQQLSWKASKRIKVL